MVLRLTSIVSLKILISVGKRIIDPHNNHDQGWYSKILLYFENLHFFFIGKLIYHVARKLVVLFMGNNLISDFWETTVSNANQL